jgi:aspartate aminotransferase-like enzyme
MVCDSRAFSGGQGQLKESIVRIGHLGFFTEEDLTKTIEQLGALLKSLGRECSYKF